MTTVPLSALSQTDDAGESVSPEVGDMVDLGKAKAKVDSIDGDTVTLSITEVNGKAVTVAKAVEADDDEDADSMESAVGDAGHKAMSKMLQREMRKADKAKDV